MQTNQTPESLAKALTNHLQLCIDDPMWPNHFEMHKDTARLFIRNINRLRDMAVSGAKDAARWQWVRAENSRATDGRWFAYPDPARLDEEIDAAIAATKRG